MEVNTMTNQSRRKVKYRITILNKITQFPEKKDLELLSWSEVKDLQVLIRKEFQINELDFVLMYKTVQLKSGFLQDYNLREGSQVSLVARSSSLELSKGFIYTFPILEETIRGQKLEKAIQAISRGILQQIKPKLTDFGTSGVYILKDENQKEIAVFKPFDEEYNAPNNPRKDVSYQNKLGSVTDRPGIFSGEQAQREVGAYLIDFISDGFHGVPPTTWVEIYHPSFQADPSQQNLAFSWVSGKSQKSKKFLANKEKGKTEFTQIQEKTKNGSLQIFVKHDDCIENLGWSVFGEEDVHRIGLLDVRILNKDRNGENILGKKGSEKKYSLIPIDHGYSFPNDLYVLEDWIIWMGFPHSKKPFSEEHKHFVEKINPRQDCEFLAQNLQINPSCLYYFRIAQTFLKIAVKRGLNLYEIGQFYLIKDEDEEQPSDLQKAVAIAEYIFLSIRLANLKPTNQDFMKELFKWKSKNNKNLENSINKELSLFKKISLPLPENEPKSPSIEKEILLNLLSKENSIQKSQLETISEENENIGNENNLNNLKNLNNSNSNNLQVQKSQTYQNQFVNGNEEKIEKLANKPKKQNQKIKKSSSAPELRVLQIIDRNLKQNQNALNTHTPLHQTANEKIHNENNPKQQIERISGESIGWQNDEFFVRLEFVLDHYIDLQQNQKKSPPKRARFQSCDYNE